MLGAIIGDYVGSVHEWSATKHKDFPLIHPKARVTDDSILTFAVAEWVMHGTDLVTRFHQMIEKYPSAGWGGMFARWGAKRSREPYNSFGNGSAMRASPVGWAFSSVDETLNAAEQSAAVTHNHPEGIKGAQATALAVYLARTTRDKDLIRKEITTRFGYDLARTCDTIRPKYLFNETCQMTVPEAIVAFLDATDYEDTIRNAISLGGDADTLACIAGGIAHAYYGKLPEVVAKKAMGTVPDELKPVWEDFRQAYKVPS